MTSFSLNFFSNQIQCSHVFLIIQFPESSNLKQSYFIVDETRDFPCIAVLPENFQSALPVFWSALFQATNFLYYKATQSFVIQDLNKDKIKSNCFLLSTSRPYSGKAVITVYNDSYNC